MSGETGERRGGILHQVVAVRLRQGVEAVVIPAFGPEYGRAGPVEGGPKPAHRPSRRAAVRLPIAVCHRPRSSLAAYYTHHLDSSIIIIRPG